MNILCVCAFFYSNRACLHVTRLSKGILTGGIGRRVIRVLFFVVSSGEMVVGCVFRRHIYSSVIYDASHKLYWRRRCARDSFEGELATARQREHRLGAATSGVAVVQSSGTPPPVFIETVKFGFVVGVE